MLLLVKAHDVSAEARDASGRWTGDTDEERYGAIRESFRTERATEPERAALRRWVSAEHREINAALRTSTPSAAVLEVASILDGLIRRSRAGSEVTLYRGLKLTPGSESLLALQPGDQVEDPGFTATSLDPAVPGRIYGQALLLRLLVPAGAAALPLQNAGHPSAVEEVLLPRDSLFEVVQAEGNEQTWRLIVPS